MLEKMLVLLERFVVAHELIAANSAKPVAVLGEVAAAPEAAEPEQKAPAKRTRAAKPKAAPEPEPEQEEEEAPKPKAKAKAKEAADIDTMRDEIKTMATHIAEGDSDECADEFDDLLEDFKVRTVTKLADDDVEEFHAEAKKIVSKYYELED
ncbi:MAG: hypothetical protein ACRCVK_21950 [Aeromonas veronii]